MERLHYEKALLTEDAWRGLKAFAEKRRPAGEAGNLRLLDPAGRSAGSSRRWKASRSLLILPWIHPVERAEEEGSPFPGSGGTGPRAELAHRPPARLHRSFSNFCFTEDTRCGRWSCIGHAAGPL